MYCQACSTTFTITRLTESPFSTWLWLLASFKLKLRARCQSTAFRVATLSYTKLLPSLSRTQSLNLRHADKLLKTVAKKLQSAAKKKTNKKIIRCVSTAASLSATPSPHSTFSFLFYFLFSHWEIQNRWKEKCYTNTLSHYVQHSSGNVNGNFAQAVINDSDCYTV